MNRTLGTTPVLAARRTAAAAGLAGATLAFLGACASPDDVAPAAEDAAVAPAPSESGDLVTTPDEGYTAEQYNAFAAAGYGGQDINALEELWNLDLAHAKAKAGQLLLDGKELPFAPGARDVDQCDDPRIAPICTAQDAGYTEQDFAELATLWNTDLFDTKVRVGELLEAGEDVPVEPSGIPETSTN